MPLAHYGVAYALMIPDVPRILLCASEPARSGRKHFKSPWGRRGRYAEERWDLRKSIQVTDDSPFRRVPIRDDLGHLDVRPALW